MSFMSSGQRSSGLKPSRLDKELLIGFQIGSNGICNIPSKALKQNRCSSAGTPSFNFSFQVVHQSNGSPVDCSEIGGLYGQELGERIHPGPEIYPTKEYYSVVEPGARVQSERNTSLSRL